MRTKIAIAVLLLAHLVVHPLMHATSFAVFPAQTASVSQAIGGNSGLDSEDSCGLCRLAGTLTLLVLTLLFFGLHSLRQLPLRHSLVAVRVYSGHRLPSRAPPQN